LSDTLKLRLEKTELELRTWQLAEERARSLAAEAKLSSLESRVRPHFLFNTLNSISALIGEEPEKAEKNVERLARLLRFSLDEANQKTVTLRAEMKVVQDYLEIEKTRFGERLRFSIKIPEEMLECRVPPFALQTSAENSIKHVVSHRRSGGEIRVTAVVEDEFLRLEVWDDGDDSEFNEDSITAGHGLDNLQARLSATFGDDARMMITRRDDYTIVSVFIPFTEAAER
jgi:LytS/YehU family sensor histidine kinase